MPPGRLIWANVGQNTNSHVEAPPKEDRSQSGQEGVTAGVSELAGRTGGPHAVLQEIAGLILGLPKAWPGQRGERGRNVSAPRSRAR